MNQEEMKERFYKNVAYLQKNIPPDDIYLFSEQTFMASLFFLKKWSEWVSINEEMEKCPITRKWVMNILALVEVREKNIDLNLDLNLDSVEE